MRTLYLRNVPDDVAKRLERLASDEGISLNAFAVRELTQAARRADNAGLLAGLADHGLGRDAVVAVLAEERTKR